MLTMLQPYMALFDTLDDVVRYCEPYVRESCICSDDSARDCPRYCWASGAVAGIRGPDSCCRPASRQGWYGYSVRWKMGTDIKVQTHAVHLGETSFRAVLTHTQQLLRV